jgi:4'-phosphopantetheinyl transferase
MHAAHIHPRAKQLLSNSEQARANRFYNPLLGKRWSYFHASLREILACYANQPPKALSFHTGHQGKPALTGFPFLHFNLSHSHDRALFAVTQDAPIGIDIELRKESKGLLDLTQNYFSKLEQMSINTLPNTCHTAAFYDVWTRKEAILKASGLGLGLPLNTFDTPLNTTRKWEPINVRLSPEDNIPYQLLSLDIDSNFSGAVALSNDTMDTQTPPQLHYYCYSDKTHHLNLQPVHFKSM